VENTLSELMQARLDKWKKNTLPNASAEKVFGKSREGSDDDESDEHKIYRKDREAWAAQVESDPRNYRR